MKEVLPFVPIIILIIILITGIAAMVLKLGYGIQAKDELIATMRETIDLDKELIKALEDERDATARLSEQRQKMIDLQAGYIVDLQKRLRVG